MDKTAAGFWRSSAKNCLRYDPTARRAAPKAASPTNIQNVVGQNSSLSANILKISELTASDSAQASINAARRQLKRVLRISDRRETSTVPPTIKAPPAIWVGDSVSPSTAYPSTKPKSGAA